MNVISTSSQEGARIKGGVGQSLAHESANRHVRGSAIYVDDMPETEGLLHAWVILSDRAHARIAKLDLSAVRAAPGVACVCTADDIPGANDVAPILADEPLLARNVVEYWGQAIAIVAAETEAQARAAAALAIIEYEDLPALLTIDAALEAKSLVIKPMRMERGDVDGAFARSVHRLEGEVRAGGQDHFYLETQVAQAEPTEEDEMRVISSTQHPSEVQHIVCRLLGVPYAAVTVEVRRMGGGFGGKESQASQIAGMAAVLARLSRRPVRLRLSRDVDMMMTGKRHDVLGRFRLGFDDEGRIDAADIVIAIRAGNVPDLSGPVLQRALCHVDNAYYLPNVRVNGYACKTHTVSNTAFRGFGGPQGMIVAEAMIAHVAAKLGRSLDEVRAANYYGSEGRDTTPYGQRVTDNNMPRILKEIEESASIAARREAIAAFNAANPVVKKGLALFPLKFGISFNMPTLNQAGALIHVYTDGSVHLNQGGTEMGQGLYLKVAQVVAECFQIDIEHVRVSSTRTDKVPNTSATAASAGSDLNGMAALAAAETIKGRMRDVAASKLGVAAEEVIFAGGRIYGGQKSLSFAELAKYSWLERVSLSAAGFYKTPEIHFDAETCTGEPFYYFTYGACVAEAAIDTLTGENRILRADIIEDVGASLNPVIDIGQIEGAFIQGMGWLTMEELWWDKEGRLKTHAPSTYKIPTSRDIPVDFRVKLLGDAPNAKPTVFRSKAIGEPPFMLALACFLALQDAVASVVGAEKALKLEAPATPEAIL
ncbi:xanthine dehydrogenase molybdopterin binding subunit, partial [Parvibaculum sp.]|uniref:xanthine dehydrogenase molybdopterin binding subunit n=1 Tax=Parvibaculum sp. TaxID=2024848 RepID=UPI003210A5A2